MHKLYTLIFSLLMLSFGWSQTIVPTSSTLNISSADVNATDLLVKSYLVNNSGQDQIADYIFNDGNTISSNWEVGFCTDAACDDPSIITSGSFSIADGDSAEIKITLLPMGYSDDLTGTIQFSFPGSTIDRVTLSYDLKVGTVGIKDIDSQSLSIFPNPASNFIQIKGIENTNDVNSIEMYSIIGKKILSKEVSNVSDLNVNIQNFEQGVYLVKLFDSKKNVFYTKTFVKK